MNALIQTRDYFSFFIANSYLCLQDLDRHVNNLTKNHKHEVGIERAHHKETQRKAKGLEAEVESLRERLKVGVNVVLESSESKYLSSAEY